MQAPGTPKDEHERQCALDNLNMLDTAIEERFEKATRLVSRLLDVPISAISLIDNKRQWFKSIQGLNVSETSREVSFCGHAILGDDTFVVEDASQDDRFADNPLVAGNPSIRFYAGQPICTPDGKKIGTLCAIDTKPRKITESEIEDLKDIAGMVETEIKSQVMAQAQLQMNEELQQAKRAVLVDPLTRLWNRKGGEEFLTRQHDLAVRNHEKFCIAMIDIDHFKSVNDTYGHDAGDEVLRQVARRALKAIRSKDFLCRLGGEEFLLIINDPFAEQALAVAQSVRKEIREKPVLINEESISVTVSIGLAYFDPAESVTCEAVIKLADEKLVLCKA